VKCLSKRLVLACPPCRRPEQLASLLSVCMWFSPLNVQVLCALACGRQTAACCLGVQHLKHHCAALQVLQRLRHVKGMALEVPWRPLRALLRRQLLARTQTYESECLRLWLSCCILLVLKHALLGTSLVGLRALLRRQLLARTQTYESECLLLWPPLCILPVLKHALLSTSPYGMQCQLAKDIVLVGLKFLSLPSNQRCVCSAGPMMLQQVVGEALTKLIRKLRRYFPAGALRSQQLWQVLLVRLRAQLSCAPAMKQHAMPRPS
jgi:hypothetical protein